MPTQSAYYIPSGPANLKPVFPAIDFNEVEEYYIEVKDNDGNIVATTNDFLMGGCCKEGKYRLHFLNYLGGFDALNFQKVQNLHTPVSAEYKKGLPNVISKQSTGIERHAVRANDTKTGRSIGITDAAIDWAQELVDSPKAFEEWTGTQGQPNALVPVVIIDKALVKQKTEREYSYDFLVEYKMANENLTIRN